MSVARGGGTGPEEIGVPVLSISQIPGCELVGALGELHAQGYAQMIQAARNQATLELRLDAETLGADGVLGVSYSYSRHPETDFWHCFASGTAVLVAQQD